MADIILKPLSNSDDGYIDSSNNFSNNAEFLRMGASGGVSYSSFVRFPVVTFPENTIITEVRLYRKVLSASGTPVLYRVYFSYEGNPTAPTSAAEYNSKTKTTFYTSGSSSSTGGWAYINPNVAFLEALNHADWVKGNAITAYLPDASSSNYQDLESLEAGNDESLYLQIFYDVYDSTAAPLQTADTGYTTGDYFTNGVFCGNYSAGNVNAAIRFPSVSIPVGATILGVKGYFFIASRTGSTSVNLKVSFEKTANPAQIASFADFNGRALTTNNTDWDSNVTAAYTRLAVDLSADALQEVIDLEGWADGNSIIMFVKNDSSPADNYYALSGALKYLAPCTLLVTYQYDNNVNAPTAYTKIFSNAPVVGGGVSPDPAPLRLIAPTPVISSDYNLEGPTSILKVTAPTPGYTVDANLTIPTAYLKIFNNAFGYAGMLIPSARLKVTGKNSEDGYFSNDYNIIVPTAKISLNAPCAYLKNIPHTDIINYNDSYYYNDFALNRYNSNLVSIPVISTNNLLLERLDGLVILLAIEALVINTINSQCTLDFTVPLNSPYFEDIQTEGVVKALNMDFIIRRILIDRVAQTVDVFAEASWYDLSNVIPIALFDYMDFSEYSFIDTSPVEPFIYALSGTPWSLGYISPEIEALSKSFTVTSKMTALEVIRLIVSFYGGELYFNFSDYTVSLLTQIGQDNGLLVTLDKNLTGLTVEHDSTNIITRLYPFGKDNLTILSVNNSVPYIEDYTNYNKLKVGTFTDERFTNAQDLYDKALVILADISKESHYYTVKAIDLFQISGYNFDKFNLGDFVTVFDKDLNLHIKTRVISMQYNVLEPFNNTLELSAKTPTLEDLLSQVQPIQDLAALENLIVYPDSMTDFDCYFNYGLETEIYLGKLNEGSSLSLSIGSQPIKIDKSGGTYTLDSSGNPLIYINQIIVKLVIAKIYLKQLNEETAILEDYPLPLNHGFSLSLDEGSNIVAVPEFDFNIALNNITLITILNDSRPCRIVLTNCINLEQTIQYAIDQKDGAVENVVFHASSEAGESPIEIYEYLED